MQAPLVSCRQQGGVRAAVPDVWPAAANDKLNLMGNILIESGTVVNEGRSFTGYVLIAGDRIAAVGEGRFESPFSGERIDARGKLVLPGVIDTHVHFREPGLESKADMASESAAAAAGGVTSVFEMPNTRPAATTAELVERKFERAAECCMVNHSFFLGAGNDNIAEVRRLDPRTVCGVKLFMGSSTGDMLVDSDYALAAVFAESPVPVSAHCEDETLVRESMARLRARLGANATAAVHPEVRPSEACYRSAARAVELADKYGAQLNVAHISTAHELTLFEDKPLSEKKITAEVCVPHLWFCDEDYARLGTLIKCNPAVKSRADREALRAALNSRRLDIVATDHAPHLLGEKLQPYWDSPSGMPMVQFSLAAMLTLSSRGVLPVETVVEKMCHAPARRYAIASRGFLRAGCFADITIVDPALRHDVVRGSVVSKCGWSPLEGETLCAGIERTIINGHMVFDRGRLDRDFRGSRLMFDR